MKFDLGLIAGILLLVGGVNWGMVGLLEYNLIAEIVQMIGANYFILRLVYTLVGLAAVYDILVRAKVLKK